MQVLNSALGSGLQMTTGLLQQSASTAQEPPSGEPVQAAQSSTRLVHTRPPAPSSMQPHPQQSDVVVHAPPSATHIAPQRRTPAESGTHTPPQQVSPKSHSAPMGKQQIIPPPRPSAHSMSG